MCNILVQMKSYDAVVSLRCYCGSSAYSNCYCLAELVQLIVDYTLNELTDDHACTLHVDDEGRDALVLHGLVGRRKHYAVLRTRRIRDPSLRA